MDYRITLLSLAAALSLTLYRPAAGLALFITVGAFKGAQGLAGAPLYLDLTVWLGGALIFIIVREISKSSTSVEIRIPKAYMILAVFCLLMTASLFYTLNIPVGLNKTARFLTLSGLAAVAPIFITKDRSGSWTFLLSLLYMGAVTAAIGLAGWVAGPTELASAFGANHITLGRMSGLALIISIGLVLFGDDTRRRSPGLIVAPIAAAALIVSSARGPLVAIIAAVPAALFFSGPWRADNRLKMLLAGTMVPLAVFSVLSITLLPKVFGDRLQSIMAIFIGGSADGSVTNRVALAERGLKAILSAPLLGLGSGSFSSVAWDLPANHYPHNLAIEVAAELGVPALFLLAGFIFLAFLTLRRSAAAVVNAQDRFVSFTLGGLLVYFLANAMLSGDINDNLMLMAVIGVAFTQARRFETNANIKDDRARGASD